MKVKAKTKVKKMNKKTKKTCKKCFWGIFGAILLLLTLGFPVVKQVLAQEEAAISTKTMTLVPPTVEENVDPGTYKEGLMKVINDADEPVTFSVTTQDFIVVDTNGTPNILPPNTLNNKYSASSWIGVSPGYFTIQPHQKQELNYYLQVPQDAKPGGHYAAVIFEPIDKTAPKGSGASTVTKVGTLFYVGVKGDIKENAKVTAFTTNGFSEYGPIKILTQIKNMGDLHIKPIGNITITDMLGRKMATLPLDEHNIFPETARDFENIFNQKLLFGPFKATFLASYGKENNLPLMATLTFWVLPWKIMLVVILVIVAVVLGIMYWKKNKARKQEEKLHKENPEE